MKSAPWADAGRYFLRGEWFGGLLFDRRGLRIWSVDSSGFKRLTDDDRVTVLADPATDGLSLSAPTKLFLVITTRCNLNCKHCANDSTADRQEELTLNEIEAILDQCCDTGVFEVGLTGGEPLCHPNFFDIVNMANERGLPLYLNTNGVYEQETVRKLADAGVAQIKVSLDGLEGANDWVRGKGSFQKAVQTIKTLMAMGSDVRINFTLTRRNEDDVFDMMTLADELGCNLKISPIVSVGRATGWSEYLPDEGQQLFEEITRFQQTREIRPHVDMVTELRTDCCVAALELASYQRFHCGVAQMHLGVDSDRAAYNTGCQVYFPSMDELGNIREHSLPELWRRANERNAREAEEKDICRRCNRVDLLRESFDPFPGMEGQIQ